MLSPMDLRRAWPTIGLAVLLVLDLVLVVWALWPSSQRLAAWPPRHGGVDGRPATSARLSPEPDVDARRGCRIPPRPLTRLRRARRQERRVGRRRRHLREAGDRARQRRPGEDVDVPPGRGLGHPGPPGRCHARRSSSAAPAGARPALDHDRRGGNVERPAVGRGGVGALAEGRPARAAARRRPGHALPGSRRRCSTSSPSTRSNATALCERRHAAPHHRRRRRLEHQPDPRGRSRPGPELARHGRRGLAGRRSATASSSGCSPTASSARGRCVDGVDPAPGEVAVGIAPSGVWLTAGDAVLRADAPGAAFARVSDWPTG